MPIYEYRCQACGHQFDEMILGREPEPDTCPKCGEKQVTRAMSAPAFQLKGSGWYVTDYKGGSPGSTSSSGSDSSSASSDSGGGDSGESSGSADSSTSSGADDTSAA